MRPNPYQSPEAEAIQDAAVPSERICLLIGRLGAFFVILSPFIFIAAVMIGLDDSQETLAGWDIYVVRAAIACVAFGFTLVAFGFSRHGNVRASRRPFFSLPMWIVLFALGMLWGWVLFNMYTRRGIL